MTSDSYLMHPSTKLKVVYLAGYQRSGSSILANVLGEQPGWVSLGEMRIYWRVSGLQDWRCGCGEPVTQCPFWGRVGDRVEREGHGWTKEEILRSSNLTRMRHLPRSWTGGGLDRWETRLGSFQDANDLLYRMVAEESGSRILVDSSKSLLYGELLDRLPSLDLYVVHLLRDPRGVAHSIARRPPRHRLDVRHGPLGLAMLLEWSILNRLTEGWGRRLGRRYVQLRYEDFIEAPKAHLERIRSFVGEDPADGSLGQDGMVELGTHHTVAGGPHRHDRGPIRLTADDAWAREQTVRRRVIELAGRRPMGHYGYQVARSQGRGALSRTLQVAGALAIRISGSVLKLVLNVGIGRTLGPSGAGTFYLFESWSKVLAIAGGLGLPSIVLRDVSVLEGNKQQTSADRLLRRSLSMASLATIGILGLMFVAIPVVGPALLGQAGANELLVLASLASIFVVSTLLISRAINGRGRANLALALESSAIPAGLILVLAAGMLLGRDLGVQAMLAWYVGIAMAVAGLGYLLWRKDLPKRVSPDSEPWRNPFHVREMATFWVLGLVGALTTNLPLLILPQLFGPAEIGLFGISLRFVTMADTVNIALMAIFAPIFARHFAQGDRKALGKDLRESQIYGLSAYMIFVIAYFLFPGVVLSVVGPGFAPASEILKIMTIGQIVNAATGPSAILLQMTRQEGSLLWINLPCLVLLAVSMVGLGQQYGLTGAAWGYTISVVVRNLAVYARARFSLRIVPDETAKDHARSR